MDEPTVVRIFVSWAHRDRVDQSALLGDLGPALGVFRDLRVEWWQDSHLTCGEELLPGILDPLDEADFGLLLLSNAFFGSAFIAEHELPRFAGATADKPALPVLLRPLAESGPERDLAGLERLVIFDRRGRSFADQRGAGRTRFANELATSIRARILGLNGYRTR